VVGEGANLGLTQRGRVEAALAGRKINTDALDNSAGVDTSDHEVNIKIVTGEAITRGTLASGDRNALLFSMTDEVAALVLRHNYQQSQAISVAEAQAAEEHDRLERFMRALERQGRLDRAVEYLPDTAAMRTRGLARQYLTRPELSVLLAYAKIDLNDEILTSDLPDDPLLEGELLRYFPSVLQGKFEPEIRAHRLRREITALQVVNSLVNRCGPTFVRNVGSRTVRRPPPSPVPSPWCATPGRCATCGRYRGARSGAEGRGADPHAGRLAALLTRTVQWTLRRLPQPIDTMAATEQLRAAVAALGDLPVSLIGEAESTVLNERAAAFEAIGAPAEIARPRLSPETLAAAGDLMQAARTNGCSIEDAARLYFRLKRAAVAGGARAAATNYRARASGRRRPRSPCWTSWRRCMPTCWARCCARRARRARAIPTRRWRVERAAQAGAGAR